jgi:hypothetical protein
VWEDVTSQSTCIIMGGIRAGDTGHWFRSHRAAESWANSEEARLPDAGSFVERSVSPCRRRSASVEERKREVPLEIRDEVQESCPR